MYAVVRTGGKQYKVKAGDLLKVEKLEKALGDEFDLNDVLFVAGKDTHIGAPVVSDAKVTVVVTQQSKHAKILVFKKKRRQGYRKLNGHRQPYTELFIKTITAPGGESDSTSKAAPIKDPEAKKEAAPKKAKAASKKASTAKKATAKKTKAKKASTKKTTKKKTT